MIAEFESLRMFNECLVVCSIGLGVPFTAPRQLGAVGDPIRRQLLPSVESGHEQVLSGARFPSISGAADRWSSGPVGAPDTVPCNQNIQNNVL
jgi:hypothetical protein